jgi:hypothetical protein
MTCNSEPRGTDCKGQPGFTAAGQVADAGPIVHCVKAADSAAGMAVNAAGLAGFSGCQRFDCRNSFHLKPVWSTPMAGKSLTMKHVLRWHLPCS